MAIKQLTPIQLDYEGNEWKSLTSQYTALDTAGAYFVNDGKTFVHIVNASGGGNCVVTIASPQECDQGGTHDITVTIPDDDDYIIGPFPTHRFNASTTGYVTFTIGEDTNVTAAAFKL
jgi:hypothetical protein